MRAIVWALLILSITLLTSGREPERQVITVSNAGELMDLFATPLNNVTVELAPGRYELDSSATRDSVSVGLRVSGRKVRLSGASADQVTIVTRAKRGVYFNACVDCDLEQVTWVNTRDDGVDGLDGVAVAVNSTVRIANCVIRGVSNQGSIPGIRVGEQTLLVAEFCEIVGDVVTGVFVCEDAHAIITNNLIDGSSHAEASHTGSSPTTAIIVHCDAQARIERNHMANYLSGIIIGGAAKVQARFNIAERMGNAGIAYLDDGGFAAQVAIESNALYECDATGIEVVCANASRVRITKNLVVGTGQRNSAGFSGPLSVRNAPKDLVVRGNTVFSTVERPDTPDPDAPREMFWRARRQWTRTYRNTAVGVDGRHKFHESAFLTRYGRWAD